MKTRKSDIEIQADEVESIGLKNLKVKHTEDVLYTENEVYSMLLKLQTSFPIHRLVQITPLELKEWFKENKK